MGMEMKLQFKLAQQLVMTPQLVQAIRLLQLSRMELVDEVRKELDGNPVLADEIAEPRGRQETSATTPAASPKDRDLAPEERIGVTDQERPLDAAQREVEKQVKEVDWEQFLENRQLQTPVGAPRSGFEELPPIEQSLTKPNTLRDHLLWQLGLSDLVDNEKQFALLVIGKKEIRNLLDKVVDVDGHLAPSS